MARRSKKKNKRKKTRSKKKSRRIKRLKKKVRKIKSSKSRGGRSKKSIIVKETIPNVIDEKPKWEELRAHGLLIEKVSTIGKEKKQNPRLQVKNENEYVEIMNNLNLKKPDEIDFNVAKNINLGIFSPLSAGHNPLWK